MPGPWEGTGWLWKTGELMGANPVKSRHPSDRRSVLCGACQNKDLCLPVSVGLHELRITGAVSNDSTLISA